MTGITIIYETIWGGLVEINIDSDFHEFHSYLSCINSSGVKTTMDSVVLKAENLDEALAETRRLWGEVKN